jgi:hypothetical protein
LSSGSPLHACRTIPATTLWKTIPPITKILLDLLITIETERSLSFVGFVWGAAKSLTTSGKSFRTRLRPFARILIYSRGTLNASPRWSKTLLYSISCALFALVLLVFGVYVYLGCRPILPVLFRFIGLTRAARLGNCINPLIAGSLPTFVHVTRLSLATCSVLRPSIQASLGVSTAWASLNIAWELFCLGHSPYWHNILRAICGTK